MAADGHASGTRFGREHARGAVEFLGSFGLASREHDGRQCLFRHGPPGVRLARHGAHDASVPASLALAGVGGAEAAVWGYRAAFALSAALSLAVLIVAVWKIR